jgi:hypothetical protein
MDKIFKPKKVRNFNKKIRFNDAKLCGEAR